jgi:hypothetical protein
MENKWKIDFQESEIKSPKDILIEQANFLNEQAKRTFRASITTGQADILNDDLLELVLVHSFRINAPALDNFRFTLLRVKQSATTFYPIEIYANLLDVNVSANDEKEFESKLFEILNSKETINALTAIYQQSVKK